MAQPWEHLPDRMGGLRRRNLVAQGVRAFFAARGYTEVETPYAVVTPGEEVHLRAIRAGEHYLHTSPEFAMKKLLAGGAGPIFQLARVWRDEPWSDTHAPEFTMLEWYAPGCGMDGLIAESLALLRAVLPPVVTLRGVTTSLARYEQVSVADAFFKYARVDVLATEGDAAALAAAANA
ncbi:MAG: EF-P lysine aminoacylase GenX, partial [Acidocella sp.]|nr:EF-P lysine aminoacylase GenX [Acidocella sp.]